jgi:phytanoyl-CoA hydroxylase
VRCGSIICTRFRHVFPSHSWKNFSLYDHPITKSSAGETSEHVGDGYFLTSATKSGSSKKVPPPHLPFQTLAGQDAFNTSNNPTKLKAKVIKQIWHYLHELSPPFASLLSPSASYFPAAITRFLGFRSPQC